MIILQLDIMAVQDNKEGQTRLLMAKYEPGYRKLHTKLLVRPEIQVEKPEDWRINSNYTVLNRGDMGCGSCSVPESHELTNTCWVIMEYLTRWAATVALCDRQLDNSNRTAIRGGVKVWCSKKADHRQ